MSAPRPVCLAVHAKVEDEVEDWQTGTPALRQAASRFQMIVETAQSGMATSFEKIEIAITTWNLKRLKGSEHPILEVGGNARGGAPRLFVATFPYGWAFLAGGVEKTQGGLKGEIEKAKSRASELARRRPEAWSEASLRAWLKPPFRVVMPDSFEAALRAHLRGAAPPRR